jgi:structural maintenance of chromosomes protein 5
VDKLYREAKSQSKEKLDHSRDVLENCDPEIREKYDELDKARVEWEQVAGDYDVPPSRIESRNAEQLRTDLEAKHQELEMHMQTNPGVVEQFKRREKEVIDFSTQEEFDH